MTQQLKIKPASSGQNLSTNCDRALAIVQRAFEQDPPVRWLYPEADSYAAHFPRFAAALGAPAFGEGTLRLSEAAAALWVRPGSEPDEAALGALIKRSVPMHRHTDVFAVLDEMGRHHPDEPHWYLPVVGTLPEMQGRGFGAAVISAVLEICDRTGVPAYLEATTERNRALYARLGFVATAEIQAADCPPMTAMVRRPQR